MPLFSSLVLPGLLQIPQAPETRPGWVGQPPQASTHEQVAPSAANPHPQPRSHLLPGTYLALAPQAHTEWLGVPSCSFHFRRTSCHRPFFRRVPFVQFFSPNSPSELQLRHRLTEPFLRDWHPGPESLEQAGNPPPLGVFVTSCRHNRR